MTEASAVAPAPSEQTPPQRPSNTNAGEYHAKVQVVSARMDTIKAEVDALQVAVLGARSVWYKDASTLISVFALLFSLTTTYVNETRANSQELQTMRSDLRGLLQRLANLPREDAEVGKKYVDDPAMAASVKGLLNQENAILSKQAAELARMLPKDKVTATEYYSVAMALQNSYNVQGAREFLQLAIDSSKDFNDKIAALRSSANLEFLMGKPEEGRVVYQTALGIFQQAAFAGYDDFTKRSTHVWTELAWGSSEYGNGTPELAMQHVQSAERIAADLRPGPGTSQLKRQIEQARRTLAEAATGAAAQSPLAPPAPMAPTTSPP